MKHNLRNKLRFILTAMLLTASLTACGNASGDAGSADAESSTQEYSKTVYAMDIPIDLKAWGKQAQDAVEEAGQELQRIDSLLSVTNAESQIGQLNARTGSTISGETLDVVRDSVRLSELTGGAFNITIYPIVRAWGFTTGGEYRVPSETEIAELLTHVGMDKFTLSGDSDEKATTGAASGNDESADTSSGEKNESDGSSSGGETVTVNFSDEKTMLDTGAITKGYASDRVYEIFENHGIESALCSLGGNVITKGRKTDGSLWKVGITDPFNPDDYCIAVAVEDKFLVTSGGYERYFNADDGTRYIHIMDPETGRPVDNDLESVTIISDHGAEADALSTALFVKGRDAAIDFWKNNSTELEFDMILIDDDGTMYVTEGVADSCTATGNYPMETIRK